MAMDGERRKSTETFWESQRAVAVIVASNRARVQALDSSRQLSCTGDELLLNFNALVRRHGENNPLHFQWSQIHPVVMHSV
jgi:hypothetical protein